MIVVRSAILAVNGDVHFVRTRHEAQAVDEKADLRVTRELVRLELLRRPYSCRSSRRRPH